ncbi:HNH endonuclease [Heliobacterium chlorum]|uniref:HNH endonuclease n=1 Tax=Heliobacterium chlorum TaxID=2698 RepID=A0ABR7T784_HELCL|nr:HNH endonuclease signature motif containing protein [Heliobacterium chlorum]MBC9786620.1 HNH endonuclease [Heliobacterium chlorum]
MSFSDFQFESAFRLASQVYLDVYENINEHYPSDLFDSSDSKFQQKILIPHKQTLLHDYIAYWHEFYLDYAIDKTGYDYVIEEVIKGLDHYGINYTLEDESDESYCNLVEEYKKLTPRIVNETFTLLFNDKRLVRAFNEDIARIIFDMKKTDYPDLLSKDGVVLRRQYLPQWLKDGVFFRDKGRCQLCGIDLTRLLNAGSKIHYDHIIPLELGGNNDPTNFQILCESCNTSKGARHSGTRNLIPIYWSFDED